MGRKSREKAARRRGGAAALRGARLSPQEAKVDRVRQLGRTLHRLRDPLEVEASMGNMLGGLYAQTAFDLGARTEMLAGLIEDAITTRDQGGLAVLHALAALLDGGLEKQARAGILRLRTDGVADPSWADRIGRYTFSHGWSAIDELEDQELVVAEFETDAGDARHAVTFMVDANFHGLVRQASLAIDASAVRGAWESVPDAVRMPVIERSAQEIADRLAPALDLYEHSIDPPSDEDVADLAQLLRARLRLLPPAYEPEHHEMSQEDRVALVADFAGSREAGRSTSARELASLFVDYKADHNDGDPLRWSPIAVELCLLDWFPRKMTLDAATRRRVTDALRRWVRYAGRRKGLREEVVSETLDAIDQFEEEFHEAMEDETRGGPAKTIVAAMQREGVDFSDQAAVERWMADFNARPIEQRDRVLGPGPFGPFLPDDGWDDDAEVDPETAARRAWILPPMSGRDRGIDLELLDPADPEERRLLIEAEHPDMHEALAAGTDIEGPEGEIVNPRLHIALHELIGTQLWDGEPPEAWEAVRALVSQGHDRHEVLHRLMGAGSAFIFEALQGPASGDDLSARMRAAYRGLAAAAALRHGGGRRDRRH